MLTDSSLTNILVVNGVSYVRYRAYSQTCKHSLFLDFLQSNDRVRSTGHEPQRRRKSTDIATENILLKAYWDLIQVNIPCMWRTRDDSTDNDSVTLELWVFWFDDRHTGQIDANTDLGLLEEFTVGSFNWKNAYATNTSPIDLPNANSNACSLVTVSDECKLFIQAIRSLVQTFMVQKGIFSLGEFFVFPTIRESDNPSSFTTLLCCAYDVYLSCTDLVFQPCAKRLRVRRLAIRDCHRKTRVLLSPSGDSAWLSTKIIDITPPIEEHAIRRWSVFFHIPIEQLYAYPRSQRMPAVVAIRTVWSSAILYPTALLFVPTLARQSPSSMAGMNSVLGTNRGLTEDLGEKWSRRMWMDYEDKSKHPLDDVNHWAYVDPLSRTTSAVLEAVTAFETLDDQGVLRKMMAEQSYGTPMTGISQITNDMPTMPPNSTASAHRELSLADYATLNFSKMPVVDTPLAVDKIESLPNSIQYSAPSAMNMQPTVSALQFPTVVGTNPTVQVIPSVSMVATGVPVMNAIYQDPQHYPPTWEEDLPIPMHMGMHMGDDTSMFDSASHWNDGADRLDNFDLDVTEEDFNFFESTPSNTSLPSQSTSYPSLGNENLMLMGQPIVVENESLQTSQPMIVDFDQLLDSAKDYVPPAAPFDTPSSDMKLGEMDQRNGAIDKSLIKTEAPSPPHSYPAAVSKESKPATPVWDSRIERFVPPEFAAIPMLAGVNDAKYSDGGKFTYNPTQKTLASDQSQELGAYQPFYMPSLAQKLNFGKSHSETSRKESVHSTHARRDSSSSGESSNSSTSSHESSDDDSNSQSSASHDSKIFEDESDGDSVESELGSGQDRWEKLLSKVQTRMALRLINSQGERSGEKKYNGDQLGLDYDTPFGSVIASGAVLPRKGDTEEAGLLTSLDHLCQQAVMGGYPFAGGLADMSTNGGEMTEGECSKLVIARRRNLFQRARGDVSHVPCLPDDVENVVLDFKRMLNDLFDPCRSLDQRDPDMSTPSLTGVKGPLDVRQYYELSDPSPTQSKYGKYQIKKRRPPEPNLETLHPPDIVVSRQSDSLEGSPNLITFWEKLRLEPYSCKKDVNYVVMCPSNSALEYTMSQFMTSLSTVYEACLLGAHSPAEIYQSTSGIAPVPLLPRQPGEGWREQQLNSYMTACKSLGSTLGGVPLPDKVYTVVYIVNPIPHLSAYLDLCTCFHELSTAFSAAQKSTYARQKTRLVLQLVPIEHVLRSSAFGGYAKFGFKGIAFSVYSKCHALAARRQNKLKGNDSYLMMVTEIYIPPFVLARSVPETLQYSLKHSLNAVPTALDRDEALHVAYSFSLDRRWMVVVWTDDRGEMVEFAVLAGAKTTALRKLFAEVWRRTTIVAQRTGFQWTCVIAKLGLIFGDELQAWVSVLPQKNTNAAIVSIDLESSLYIGTRYAAHGINNDPPSSVADHGASMYGLHAGQAGVEQPPPEIEDEVSGSRVLMLNHRVAYTRGRERAHDGVVMKGPVTRKEQWMLSLATGFLIHSSQKGVSPKLELFGCEPLVIEFHLVFNQTDRCAYSTLTNIIRRHYSLSYVNQMPSESSRIPLHLALVERLCRLLLVVDNDS